MSVVTATINPSAVSGSSSAAPIISTVTITPDLTYRAPFQSSTPTAASSTKSRPTGPTKSPAGADDTVDGLSESAQVGIGVGVGVGVLCLALGALLGFFLRRRRRPAKPEREDYVAAYQLGKVFPSEGGYSADLVSRRNMRELPGKEQAQELTAGKGYTAELPGSTTCKKSARHELGSP